MPIPELKIGPITSEKKGNVSRVSADVDGTLIWFETEHDVLCPSPEAFACAFVIAALLKEHRLVMEDALSGHWLSNMPMLMNLINKWWGTPRFQPVAPVRPDSDFPKPRTGEDRRALLFSGGADSFHSLLRGRYRPDKIVFIHGYDIPLEDLRRFQPAYETFMKVAEEAGVKPVLIRTNLRQHPLIQSPQWMHIHGGAMAAAGHLLSNSIHQFFISSTNSYTVEVPWGSHWQLDEMWSSDRLHVMHIGADRTRNDKLRLIAGNPLVQRHLRVCLANLSPQGNCSVCEKCLRTMLVLHQCGQLQNFSAVFDLSVPLNKRFEDAKPPMQTMGILLAGYAEVLDRGLEPGLEKAVRGFLERYKLKRKANTGRVRQLLGPKLTAYLREKIFE